MRIFSRDGGGWNYKVKHIVLFKDRWIHIPVIEINTASELYSLIEFE